MEPKGKSGRYVLDQYVLSARLKPAFLVIFPMSVLIAAFGLNISIVFGALAAPLSAAGFTFLLAQIARDPGKKKESGLFKLWDGKPTTVKLRHRDPTINPHTRDRYHREGERLTGKQFPTAEQESFDPQAADLLYETLGDLLKERTRDKEKYPLIFDELLSYGFRRNLWGMKPTGVILTIVALLLQGAMQVPTLLAHQEPSALMIVLFALNVTMLFLWIAVIDPSWVKTAGDAYAVRLLSACETLSSASLAQEGKKQRPIKT